MIFWILSRNGFHPTKGLRLIADSNEIFVSEEAAYLSVASSPVRLHLRAEIFGIILGLYSFFIYNGHHSGPTQPSIRRVSFKMVGKKDCRCRKCGINYFIII